MSGVGMMLLGSGSPGAVITIATQYIDDTNTPSANAAYYLYSTGVAYSVTSSGPAVNLGNWVTPTSAAANYEVYATLVSGTLSSGTTGSWLPLSTTRSWSRSRGTSGFTYAQITVDIRLIGTTTVLGTASIGLSATVP